MSALTQKDGYKIGHPFQFPSGMTEGYVNLTPRSNHLQNVPTEGVIHVGAQHFCKDFLIEEFDRTFFNQPREKAVKAYQRRVSNHQGRLIDVEHIYALHQLGYLPIEVKSLPEGSMVPYGVPTMTIRSTHPDFAWVPSSLEDILSSGIFLATTSATTYFAYHRLFVKYARLTGSPIDFCSFQGHDFSLRGMERHAAAISGFGALAAGAKGTDCLPAIDLAEDYYGANSDIEVVGVGLPATEHGVMCADGQENELATIIRLITEVYPDGNVGLVADAWDFWKFVTEYLPKLKPIIMARDGKLIIRPDSGDPVKIICGDIQAELGSPERKGLIRCLWEIFGGTTNSLGFKHLDSHIGAIYGDSITYDRALEILARIAGAGFASDNIVFGIGSYTYAYITRDTHGFAVKLTHAIINGKRKAVAKDPKTSVGFSKKSAKGYLMVTKTGNVFGLVEDVTADQERMGCLETILLNSQMVKEVTLEETRATSASYIDNVPVYIPPLCKLTLAA